jgi:pSer/pThr/pTyr-binding forkhead associated (FHA) protein
MPGHSRALPGATPIVVQAPGRTVMFDSGFTVGRGAVDLVLADEFASLEHARFTYLGGWFVDDLGSVNGTQVNGVWLIGSRRLVKGDRVRIGHTELIVVPV